MSSVRDKVRQELIGSIDVEDLDGIADEIARAAWGKARSIQQIAKGMSNMPRDMDEFKKLSTSKKQKALTDWLLVIATDYRFQRQYIKGALMDPFTHMKLVASQMPKQVEVTTDNHMSVVLLPAKSGSVDEWMKMVNGGAVEGEVLLDQRSLDAAAYWQQALTHTPEVASEDREESSSIP